MGGSSRRRERVLLRTIAGNVEARGWMTSYSSHCFNPHRTASRNGEELRALPWLCRGSAVPLPSAGLYAATRPDPVESSFA